MSSGGIPAKHCRENPDTCISGRHLRPDRSGGPDPDDPLASLPQKIETGQDIIAQDPEKALPYDE